MSASRKAGPTGGLFVHANFVRAVRESGYTSLATALAELIDNSLQADATTVDILIARDGPGDGPDITVIDNGLGMGPDELEACLQFGGTTRFDDRGSFGRFGMGLPAASLSQSRHIEVVSWQGNGCSRKVVLDVDAVVAGRAASLKAMRSDHPVETASGCAVTLKDCDRIEYQRLAWLQRALHRDLGRIYRRFIQNGLVLRVNGTRVKARDPLLLKDVIEGHTASLAFDPMRYELATAAAGTSFVEVRFSILPVHEWHHLDNLAKRRAGIVGAGGVSILRAGREIAFGWHFMGAKRKENYDDWWRCEIEFQPELDEAFGITINKQGIRPSPQLRDALDPELEAVARLLNSRVRQAFEQTKFREASEKSCRIAEAADPKLPILKTRGRRSGPAGTLNYRLKSAALQSGVMMATHLQGGTIEVTLNTDHPSFDALYGPLQSLSNSSGESVLRTAIELLILSFARTSLMEEAGATDDVLEIWSAVYAKMLQST